MGEEVDGEDLVILATPEPSVGGTSGYRTGRKQLTGKHAKLLNFNNDNL